MTPNGFERISRRSPQLAMSFAEACKKHGGYIVGLAIEDSLDEIYQTGNEQFQCEHRVFHGEECEECEKTEWQATAMLHSFMVPFEHDKNCNSYISKYRECDCREEGL